MMVTTGFVRPAVAKKSESVHTYSNVSYFFVVYIAESKLAFILTLLCSFLSYFGVSIFL